MQKDIKSECSCCENPITNELMKFGVNTEVRIEFITESPNGEEFNIPVSGKIVSIGEGIVILNNVLDREGIEVRNLAISTCHITRFEPINTV
ncbi:hypothetical protein [Chengkuizengella axinellae]|uniref:Uncharacterized protein n=1 Tax=Chengkuizengella axinellae TaxID=3064388 RepID=A0ABT9J0W4_9BACL|nr:hypothetical protein [Chengkuizengella sp. 2205SS18-9]MDP5275057.1 hypothetical protein [Chengkuizengella sp. 2205SS18-9]